MVGAPGADGCDRYLRPFKVVVAVKYAAMGIEPVAAYLRVAPSRGFVWLLTSQPGLFWPARFVALPVAAAAIAWVVRPAGPWGMVAMAGVTVDAILKIGDQGLYFFNHYFLQAFVGILGFLAVARQRRGDQDRTAWNPVAVTGVVVWALAGLKKLAHATYIDGEYIVSVVGQAKRNGLHVFSQAVLAPDGVPNVPEHCCISGELDVPLLASAAVIGLGVAIVAAEISPLVALAATRNREIVGWLTLAVTIIATGLADEMDFGMTLVALTVLLGEGRRFRLVSVATGVGMAIALLWGTL